MLREWDTVAEKNNWIKFAELKCLRIETDRATRKKSGRKETRNFNDT